jgi:hypothetical protein
VPQCIDHHNTGDSSDNIWSRACCSQAPPVSCCDHLAATVALRIANGQVLLVTPRPRPLQGVRRVKSDSCLPFERATLTVNPRRVSMGLSRLPSRVLIMTVSRLATDPGVDSQRSCYQILHFGSKSYVVSSKHNRALQPCNLGELYGKRFGVWNLMLLFVNREF